jgi:hypothetical protein
MRALLVLLAGLASLLTMQGCGDEDEPTCPAGERTDGGKCDCNTHPAYKDGTEWSVGCHEGACYASQDGCDTLKEGDGSVCNDETERVIQCCTANHDHTIPIYGKPNTLEYDCGTAACDACSPCKDFCENPFPGPDCPAGETTDGGECDCNTHPAYKDGTAWNVFCREGACYANQVGCDNLKEGDGSVCETERGERLIQCCTANHNNTIPDGLSQIILRYDCGTAACEACAPCKDFCE